MKLHCGAVWHSTACMSVRAVLYVHLPGSLLHDKQDAPDFVFWGHVRTLGMANVFRICSRSSQRQQQQWHLWTELCYSFTSAGQRMETILIILSNNHLAVVLCYHFESILFIMKRMQICVRLIPISNLVQCAVQFTYSHWPLFLARKKILIHSSMARQPFDGPWPLQFRNLVYADGRTPWTSDQPVARPIPAHRTTQTQNKCTQTFIPLSGIRTQDPSVWADKDCSCFRPRGHRDWGGKYYFSKLRSSSLGTV
jgi:hypothetical protein